MTQAPRLSVDLMAHASIRIRAGDVCVLCDPWYMGQVFNNGWALSPAPDLDRFDFSDVTHLWISHEHPDHMHFPTLRWLAEQVDPSDVTFLFQSTNSDKVFEALRGLGFTRCVEMPHLQPIRVSPELELFVYAHRQLDAALGVIWKGQNAVLNINDTELSRDDCAQIRGRFGTFPLLFNQFSMGGLEVHDDAGLAEMRREILGNMIAQHRALGGRYTVPFASFISFCCPDNHDLNRHRSTVPDAQAAFAEAGEGMVTLVPQGPGLSFTPDEIVDMHIADEAGAPGDAYFAELARTEEPVLIVPEDNLVALAEVQDSFATRTRAWRAQTLGPIYNRLGTIRAFITDLEQGAVLDFPGNTIREAPDITAANADLLIASQPLDFAFRHPFGVQTLGVSGRFRFPHAEPGNWRWVRIISALHNSDIHLGLRSLLRPATLRWIWQRRRGLGGQIRQQIRRFFRKDITS